jgi:ABC-2 type transport system ATP-binding protein
MDEANRLCDRVAIINHGKITAIDRPAKLKNIIKRLNSVEISFDKTISTDSLSEISHVSEVLKEGDKFVISTDNVNGFLYSFTAFAESQNLKIISLNTLSPSLEEVFIQLTSEV